MRVWDCMGTGYGTLWGLGMGLYGDWVWGFMVIHTISQNTKLGINKSFVAAITTFTFLQQTFFQSE